MKECIVVIHSHDLADIYVGQLIEIEVANPVSILFLNQRIPHFPEGNGPADKELFDPVLIVLVIQFEASMVHRLGKEDGLLNFFLHYCLLVSSVQQMSWHIWVELNVVVQRHFEARVWVASQSPEIYAAVCGDVLAPLGNDVQYVLHNAGLLFVQPWIEVCEQQALRYIRNGVWELEGLGEGLFVLLCGPALRLKGAGGLLDQA